jgi:hypothetical protein
MVRTIQQKNLPQQRPSPEEYIVEMQRDLSV